MTAMELTRILGGSWQRSYGTAPCPVCQPERRKGQTALTIRDGSKRLLLHCKKSGCSFVEILDAAGLTRMCLDPGSTAAPSERRRPRDEDATSEFARRLWDESVSATGTPAETYLRAARRITAPIPSALRFNARTWHGPSRRSLPALIARIEGGTGFAVNRTFLQADGSGKAMLPDGRQKLMLGPSQGGHVLLRSGGGRLVVAEGLETGLSLASGLVDDDATVWATLTASNMRSVRLPAESRKLIIATDGDEAGRTAGACLAERARHLGWCVDFMPAPEGKDWNDVLFPRSRAARQDAEGFTDEL